MSILKQVQNRREFLRSCGRNITLTAVGLVGGALVYRKSTAEPGQNCINEFICDGCRVFTDCILPQAQSAKKTLGL